MASRIVTAASKTGTRRAVTTGARASGTGTRPPLAEREPGREATLKGIDPSFHRAILKIALELKKPNAASYDSIVAATIASMKLDPVRFRRYLGENGARNMSLLLATARTAGI